ncbi:ATP-binding protein [Streptomyces bomunensis]|uniref:ATP-binding protein n=2 Tax=Streptomyces montanisoli TaxID=2798581 RepID=A0A940RTN2_9ACTN|nr:ATP-binding protein [Streptomyces montanisoli]MBP0456265.1 ATP-binding protein [Streptomyces montanisoli]
MQDQPTTTDPPCCPPPDGPPPTALFAADPESARAARVFAREVVENRAPGAPADSVSDVQLVVSELVTNAIRYGTEPGDSLALIVDATPQRVRVEVHDPRRRRPAMRAESPDRQRGRGLFIVDTLAQWGIDDRPFGKIVWAELTWTNGEAP